MPHAHSLDRVAAGDTVTVERILFDGLRSHCAQRGVTEGARLSCRTTDAGAVVMETAAGRSVPCARDLARFIEVTSAGPGR